MEDDAASATEEEDWEEDNERLFGYDLDREVDVWAEYQAAIEDPLFALYYYYSRGNSQRPLFILMST